MPYHNLHMGWICRVRVGFLRVSSSKTNGQNIADPFSLNPSAALAYTDFLEPGAFPGNLLAGVS